MSLTYRFTTSEGNFDVELFADMPITVGNFVDLVETGFYNGLLFHRVIDGFMCQFGCPWNGDKSKAGASPIGNTKFKDLNGVERARDSAGKIQDEFLHQRTNERGTLSMANQGRPHTGGSQFFINTVHNRALDYFDDSTPSMHPVFGRVVAGMDTIDRISACPKLSGTKDKPNPPIVVKSVSKV